MNPRKAERTRLHRERNQKAALKRIANLPPNLNTRKNIINTHKQFISFMDTPLINALLYLFDKKPIMSIYNEYNIQNQPIINHIFNNIPYTNLPPITFSNKLVITNNKHIDHLPKISDYLMEELQKNMNTADIHIINDAYLDNNELPNFIIEINKNGTTIIHLTIHLVVSSFDPKDSGILHFYKNVYPRKQHPMHAYYGLIRVEPQMHTIQFSLGVDYPLSSMNQELQVYMNSILKVLNLLFIHSDYLSYVYGQTRHPLLTTFLTEMNRSSKRNRKNKYHYRLIEKRFPPSYYTRKSHRKPQH